MSKEIILHAVSPSMEEGKIVRWLKAEGEAVKMDEPLCEIETDKAIVEIVAPAAGTLGKILFAEGTDNVRVDSVIALLLEEGEDRASLADRQPAAAAPLAHGARQADIALVHAVANGTSGRLFASPLARRVAGGAGLDLQGVSGSGPAGRILKLDVLRVLDERSNAAAATAPARQAAALVTRPAPPAVPAQGNVTEIPHTSMRKAIARRLTESKQSVPHFYLTVDIDIDGLLDFREQLNSRHPDGKISVNDLIVKAAATALKKVPACNASWSESALLRYNDIDISVAVSTEGGLITPIVRKADQKGVAAISAEIKELADKARNNKLKPDEFQGGGFSISNLGMYGIKEFAAIINPPQSAILAVGAGEQRAVVKNGVVSVATVMACTLSVDHRVIDGVAGAQFLAQFKKLLQDPLSMML